MLGQLIGMADRSIAAAGGRRRNGGITAPAATRTENTGRGKRLRRAGICIRGA
jgi:hypothetical protein